jgi:hypothetical protein
MRPSEHAQATRPSPSIGRPAVHCADLSRRSGRIGRLQRSRLAWPAAMALGSLVLAGMIVLALPGIEFAGIGRPLSNVHP